jgi:TRAP-type mannitol/chloroaromatic compound transport system permease small subunit
MQKISEAYFESVEKWEAARTRPGYGSAVQRLTHAFDRLSFALAVISMVSALVLTGVMTYEVVVRRLFNSPTLWAYDISYMLNGTLVFLGGAYTLIKNEHVRIDFLATRLPQRVQDLVNAAFYLLLFLPILGVLAYTAIGEAWRAYATGALEPASTWGPLSWPFYAALSVGLAALFLQSVAQMLRHVQAARGHGPSPLIRTDGEGAPG